MRRNKILVKVIEIKKEIVDNHACLRDIIRLQFGISAIYCFVF